MNVKYVLLELLKHLYEIITLMESVRKALEDFLETKRQIFPRFYFISNDMLLEILGQSKNPQAVQPHLKNCFDNIRQLEIVKVCKDLYELLLVT